MLHPVHVPQQGLGQVCQIPLPEVSEGQLAEPLCHAETSCLYLIVYQTVGSLVLLQMGEK